MFTPPASPAPPRVARQPSPTPSASEDEDAPSQYLLVPRSASQDGRSSSLTVPPSPPPRRTKRETEHEQHAAAVAAKQRVGRHTRWTILLVPAVLLLITLSTRYLSHPAVLDIFSRDRQPASWETWTAGMTDLTPHKRHASPDPDPGDTSSLILQFPTASSSSGAPDATPSSSGSGDGQVINNPDTSTNSTPSAGTQTVPTIPASPPVLPTPFPQPLDQTLNENYSTVACQNFFNNMTTSTAFRSCRPFSLLSQSSNAFIQAQQNITALNDIIWGTCNTSIDFDTCVSNMAWFSDTLKTQCAQDLKLDNAIVQSTLTGLEAYTLLHNTACLPDQTTNTYCYIEAVNNSNPADLYFYSLPLGIAVPQNITPSCSACTKSVMSLYAQDTANLSALGEVYNGAATVANKACGEGYVQITSVSNSAARVMRDWWAVTGVVGLLVAASLIGQ